MTQPNSADITHTLLKPGEQTHAFYDIPLSTGYLSIDLVDACNLRCPTCLRGQRYMKNRRRQMDFDLFAKILDKAVRLGFHTIALYNWTEPFLCRDLPRYTAQVKARGLRCRLSSNLSFPHLPQLIPTLATCDELIVSLSGFSQETYCINHRGGNITFVKKNLKKIAEAKARGDIPTKVDIRYFIFDYSEAEYPQFEAFTKDLGLNIIRWHGKGNPHMPPSPLTAHDERAYLALQRSRAPFVPAPPIGKVCRTAIVPVNVDWRGDVFLCCSKANFDMTRVGNFLEDDFDLLQYRRMVHPLCGICKVHRNVDIAPYHAASLIRGLARSLAVDAGFVAETAREAALAEALAGRDVYFWGDRKAFQRKRQVFAACNVRCLLSDEDNAPASIKGMPMRHPDEVLREREREREREILPIVIFGEQAAQERIAQTIRTRYPDYQELFFCATT